MICVNEEFMLAIIPARGGSKGVQKKNIRLLGGKPLIQWTIEAAMHATSIDRVILSTDDDEIAEVCKPLEVEIPFMRPKELAQDDSLAIDNYIYTIDRLNNEFHENIEEFVVLLPTSPLRTPEDIDGAIKLFQEKDADSVISCVEMTHPPFWAKRIIHDARIESYFSVDPGMLNKNRQDLDAAYIPNGSIFVFKYSLLKEKYNYYSDKTYSYIMNRERSVDIDSILDFNYVEYLIGKK